MSSDTMDRSEEIEQKTEEIKRLVQWLAKFSEGWQNLHGKTRFPENAVAAHHLSMLEDTARQIAVLSAEIQEIKRES